MKEIQILLEFIIHIMLADTTYSFFYYQFTYCIILHVHYI